MSTSCTQQPAELPITTPSTETPTPQDSTPTIIPEADTSTPSQTTTPDKPSSTPAPTDTSTETQSATVPLEPPPPVNVEISSDHWEQTSGPRGASVLRIAVDPQIPDIVYAGLTEGGIYRSDDGGETWIPVLVKSDSYIRSIVTTPDSVFAASHSIGLQRSDDHGLTWQEVEIDPEDRPQDVAYSTHGEVLLTSTHHGHIYSSHDNGRTWQNVTGDLPRDRASSIVAAGSSEYWVGHSNELNGGLYHTTDGGIHWKKATLPQPSDTDVFSILIANDDPQTIYVSLGNVHNEPRPPEHDYLWKTRDGGRTWQPIHYPFDPDSGWWWFMEHSSDDSIYLSAALRVWRSTDRSTTWQKVDFDKLRAGVGTGDIRDMAIHPANPDILYIPLLNGIAKSTDGGKNWALYNEGMILTRINLLATHPTYPSVVYAASSGGEGTFRSEDYGENWAWLNGGGLWHPWADELVTDPGDIDNIYEIVDVSDIYHSTDRGSTWSRIWPDFRYNSVYSIAIAPSDPDIIYALKNGFGIFKSENGGYDWQFLHQSGVDYTYSIAIHPENPDIVFSGYSPKPFQDWAMVRRTLDGGYSWETVLEIPQSKGVTSIAIDPNNPETIYAGSIGDKGGSIYVSNNSGDSWKKLNDHFNMCTVWGQPQLIVDPDDSSIAYCATWLGGTWKTVDAGETWTLLEEAPVSATSLSFNMQNSDIIYLADRTSPTVWKSMDAGETWQLAADFSDDGAFLLNRIFADGDIVYAATFGPGLHSGRLYKSIDAGSTWADITGTLPRSVLDVAVNPNDPDVVYVTTHIYGSYKSTDGGNTWDEMQNFPDIGAYDIEVDPFDPATLYTCGLSGSVPDWCMGAGGYTFTNDAGVYKSTDSGLTWSQVLATSNECRAIRLHSGNHDMLFAVSLDDGLQVSINGGDSWTSYNTGLDTQVLTSCTLNGDKIYVGTQACGVYSGDIDIDTGAVIWQAERSNKPVPAVYSLQIEVDPADSNRIFVGSNPGGLYRSDNGGVTFYDKNFLTPTVVVDDPYRQGYYTLALNPSDTSEVWLGTWGKGVFKSYDSMDFDIFAHGDSREMLGKHIYQVVIEPKSPETIYAATEEGIYRTINGGTTWSDFSTGLHTSQIRSLTISRDGVLYAGSMGYGLYRCDPASDSVWQQLPALANFGTFWPIWDDRPLYQYTSLLIHPTDNQIMYLGTFPAGIYKSTDGGTSWRESNVGWTNDGVFCLVFHPDNTDIIYAGTYNGLNRSLDGGEHWETWDKGWPAEQWVFDIEFDPHNPDIMYACSKNGEDMGRGREGFHGTVTKSIDGGANWFEITSGLNVNQEFYNIVIDPVLPDTLYMATQNEGIFITRDGGNGWSPWNEGLDNLQAGTNGNNVTSVLALSADGKVLYFGTNGSGVWRRRLEQ
ncbi:WD40/YVTN/BNR-like repeat-containing protein [Chloroflexota bacterium]